MTTQGFTGHPSQVASRAAGGAAAPNGNGMMPLVGLMVRPFPEPGPTIRTAMEQLQQATVEPPADEDELRELAQMPRPWDPATCTGLMRSELWAWLDLVAMWVNVHDLAVLACSRYYTSFAVTPAALEDWHRYALPGFLERLRDRLGDGCQPSKHQPRPRRERDESHASTPVRRGRKQRYRDDVDRTGELEAVANKPDDTKDDNDDLHERW
jgi:hypothetical protein